MKNLSVTTAEEFERSKEAPSWPADRPPTRKEVWNRFSYIFPNKERDDLTAYCREAWVWYYVEAYNFRGWRKQPDWKEGDPVIETAVPSDPFFPGSQGKWDQIVYACLNAAKQMAVAA